jgi:hypothetical protein
MASDIQLRAAAVITVALVVGSALLHSSHATHGAVSDRGDSPSSDGRFIRADSMIRRLLPRHRRQSTTSGNATTLLADIVSMLGPRAEVDLVAILDRSINIGKHEFYYYDRPIVEFLLRYYATVDQRYARVAAVTFALTARVAFDGISNGPALTKCQLFNDDEIGLRSMWNNVAFNDSTSEQFGRNIVAALQQTIDILNAGRQRRPSAKQVSYTLLSASRRPTTTYDSNFAGL